MTVLFRRAATAVTAQNHVPTCLRGALAGAAVVLTTVLLPGCGGGGGDGAPSAAPPAPAPAPIARSGLGIGPAGGGAEGGAAAPGFRVEVPAGALADYAWLGLAKSGEGAPAASLAAGETLASHVYRIEAAAVANGRVTADSVAFARPMQAEVPIEAGALLSRRVIVQFAAVGSAQWQRIESEDLAAQAALGSGATLRVALPGPGTVRVVGVSGSAGAVSAALDAPAANGVITRDSLELTINAADTGGVAAVALWSDGPGGVRRVGSAARAAGSAQSGTWALTVRPAAADNGSRRYVAVVSTVDGRIDTSNVLTTTIQRPLPASGVVVRAPRPQVVAEGARATFEVQALAAGALAYQWLRNGSPIAGADSASYTSPPLTAATHNGDTYAVRITAADGVTHETEAVTTTVTIQSVTAPTITTQPTHQTIDDGASFTFSAVASGTTLSYQWQRLVRGRWQDLLGANGSTLSQTGFRGSDHQAQFRLMVTNSGGAITSNAVTLTVLPGLRDRLTPMSAGFDHTLLMNSAGKTFSCGANASGQLGDGTTVAKSAPTPVSYGGYEGYVNRTFGVAAGYYFSARGFDWTFGAAFVDTWGFNGSGQLGTNNTVNQASPFTQTVGPNEYALSSQVAAGDYFTLTLKNGLVYAAGVNARGVLGVNPGTLGQRNTFGSEISGLSNVHAVAAGGGFGLALSSGGNVLAWGSNFDGAIGNGCSSSGSPYWAVVPPVQVTGLPRIVAVAAGATHSLALAADGTVWAWGRNEYGQLGVGRGSSFGCSPTQVPGLRGVVAIAAGAYHSLALLADGSVLAWGSNSSGQLGDGTQTDQFFPVYVPGATDVAGIAGGVYAYHSLAVRTDGTVLAWGQNSSGQLCLGTGTAGGVRTTATSIPNFNLGPRTRPF